MRSLAALNEKLMFKGAEKGFEKVSDASEKVKFNALLNALDNLSQKFSAVEVIGVTALMRITNQAVDAGERLVKALSLDPIISGFQEYETQINAVQTILANTSSKGTTLDQVNAALDELNHYADLTIYNFTEMTRNIGTFTAAGVDLNTSVSAIKGIANLAAVSGSTSQQASTAMYQLSQALASGTVKLQDWNSVVNAGMGGQVFQDALKETARVHGIAIDSMIKKEGSFRETLSKGWLTSSILTETLQKFTGDLNEETLKSIGYTDEQIKKIMEMGKTANDAATKVKTFSQLKDTLTEALQSGWTQTWQTIIGDFEEAKELFTRFSDVFSDLINKSSEARNTMLAGGLNTGWQQLSTALGDSADFYSQMLEKVMLANGSISQKQIDDAGSFAKALQQGGVSAEQLQNGLKESYKQLSALGALSDDALKAKKLDPAQVRSLAKSFEEVNQQVADGSLNLDIYSKKIGKLSGREHLIESIWNVFEALEKVVEPVARAWQKIFSPITADQIYNIAKSIDEFTAKLSISDETADKIERTFSGIFAVLNVGKNVLLTVGKVLGEVFNAVSKRVQRRRQREGNAGTDRRDGRHGCDRKLCCHGRGQRERTNQNGIGDGKYQDHSACCSKAGGGDAVCRYSILKNGNEKLSEHFKVREFYCRDGSDPVFIDTALVEVLEKIRTHFGKPVTITSGFRTASWNAKQKNAAKFSQHLYGKAADIRVQGISVERVYAYADKLLGNAGGCGIYPPGLGRTNGWVHVDVRKAKSRWKG